MRCPDLAGLFPAWTRAPWHEDITDRDVDPVRTARWQDSTAVRADSTGVPYYVIGTGRDMVRGVVQRVGERKKPPIITWTKIDLFPSVQMPIPQAPIEWTVMDNQVFVVDPANNAYWEAAAFGPHLLIHPWYSDRASRWDTSKPWAAQWQRGIIAARLPLLPMLPTFAEFERGEILHAWQVCIDGFTAKDFVPPAFTTDGQHTPGKARAGDRLRLTAQGRKRLLDAAQSPHDATAVESWARFGLIAADRTGHGHLLRVARDERIRLTVKPTANDFEIIQP